MSSTISGEQGSGTLVDPELKKLTTGYTKLSPSMKDWYNKTIKINSGKKKEFIYITKKGEQTTKTLKQFLKLFIVYDDAPPPPASFLEKIGRPPTPEKGEGYKKLVEKYESQIETKSPNKQGTVNEEDDPEYATTENDALFLSSYRDMLKLVENQLREEKNDRDPIIRKVRFNKLLDIYANAEPFVEDPSAEDSKELIAEWTKIYDKAYQLMRVQGFVDKQGNPYENWNDYQKSFEGTESVPNPLQTITEQFKVQEVQEVQQKRLDEVKNMDQGLPVDPVTAEEANQFASIVRPGPGPGAIINPNLDEVVVMYDEPLLETAIEDDYPDIGLTNKTTVAVMGLPIVQEIGSTPTNQAIPQVGIAAEAIAQAQVDIAAGDSIPPDESFATADQIPTDITPSITSEEAQVDQPIKPNVEARAVFKFEVKFHKAQIAEYFFNWNAPAWDQQLSDSIKQSEELYTKEYLLNTMQRLVADPYFKIDSVATDMNSSMDDILTEYHEISQIQFCKQRNMQTGKREKLIGMKLKDLFNITSIATGNQPIEQDNPYAVDGVNPVDENGNEQMQPTPTEPSLVVPESDVLFEKDKNITIWDIGEKAMENLNNENKPFNLNQELIKDAQNKPGIDLFMGPDNEKIIFKNRVDIASLRRIVKENLEY